MKANRNTLPFLTSHAYLKQRTDISIPQDEFIELAYPIWRQIGNTASDTFTSIQTVPSTGIINLPEGCVSVKSVTTFNPSTNVHDFGSNASFEYVYTNNSLNEHSESFNEKIPDSYVLGDTVHYTMEAGYIYIPSRGMVNKKVVIAYHTVDTDEDGLPFLNDREVEAIAMNVAKRHAELALWRREKGAADLLNYISPIADKTMVLARTPEYISENQLDALLDVKCSSERKFYGKRIKFR